MSFSQLVQQVTSIHGQFMRRDCNPDALRAECIDVIQSFSEYDGLSSDDLIKAPDFLRAVSSIVPSFHDVPSELLPQQLLELTDRTVNYHNDFNELSRLATSSCLLLQMVTRSATRHRSLQPEFASVVARSFNKAIATMRRPGTIHHTSSVVALLRVANARYHSLEPPHTPSSGFRFTPLGVEMRALLPVKSKLQMEAKLQKTGEARELLQKLRTMHMNRIDAGTLLNTMSDCGLYDEEVANVCCETLGRQSATLTDQQRAQVLYALGVTQHRHVNQKLFSRGVQLSECNLDGARKYVMGLAALQQKPESEERLVDGLFLHARRYPIGEHPLAASKDWLIDTAFALTCSGIRHHKYAIMTARECRRGLGQSHTHTKLKFLYTLDAVKNDSFAEDLQGSVGKIRKTREVLLETLKRDVDILDGPLVTAALVHCDVTDHPLIPKISNITSSTSSTKAPYSAAASSNTSGVEQRAGDAAATAPSLPATAPQAPSVAATPRTTENPVQQILQAWTTLSSSDRMLHMTERIQMKDFSHDAVTEGSQAHTEGKYSQKVMDTHSSSNSEFDCPPSAAVGARIAEVFSTIAFKAKCRVPAQEVYRISPLCNAAAVQTVAMAAADVLTILRSMSQLGISDRFEQVREALVGRLWQLRGDMDETLQLRCCDVLAAMPPHVPLVPELLDFVASAGLQDANRGEDPY